MIIPQKCQPHVLAELHAGHQRIVKMKGLARSHAWWLGIEKQINELVGNCGDCQEICDQPPVIPLHHWLWPSAPWERVHNGFSGPFMGSCSLS